MGWGQRKRAGPLNASSQLPWEHGCELRVQAVDTPTDDRQNCDAGNGHEHDEQAVLGKSLSLLHVAWQAA